jgi:4-diphosphocytidyl-2-C-methyl-D-erythritol kinase
VHSDSFPGSTPGVRVRVPAKVNLHLSVGPLRPDGFHELVTVFQAVGLTDEVLATPAPAISLRVAGAGMDEVPTDHRNLAWRAAALLAETAGFAPDVALELTKSIPVAGGMAGGSADAAATLLACARLWDLDAGPTELSALAARLGSDVAFPLLGGTALGTGRGEVLTPLACPTPLHWVFALADFGISAGDAYRELDRLRAEDEAEDEGEGEAVSELEPAGPPDRLVAALENADLATIAGALVNDLEAAALSLAPQLADVLAAGSALGALRGMVSGSGPTCAFLCASTEAANELAFTLGHDRVCSSAVAADGPVAGAHVVERASVAG